MPLHRGSRQLLSAVIDEVEDLGPRDFAHLNIIGIQIPMEGHHSLLESIPSSFRVQLLPRTAGSEVLQYLIQRDAVSITLAFALHDRLEGFDVLRVVRLPDALGIEDLMPLQPRSDELLRRHLSQVIDIPEETLSGL